MYSYISGSSFVFIQVFGVTEQHFGWIFALVAGGLITASQFNTRLLKRFSSEQIIKGALTIQGVVGIILVSTSIFGWSELYSTIVLVMLFLCCQGFLFPNASALSMAPFANNAGNASALMGFIQMSVGALMSAMVSELVRVLPNNNTLPMTGVMAFCTLTASLIFYIGRKIIVKNASIRLVEEEEVEMINTL